MAEWLGIGLQNRAQQFDSAWYLLKDVIRTLRVTFSVLYPYTLKAPWRESNPRRFYTDKQFRKILMQS